MCGIVGVFHPGNSVVDNSILEAMRDSMLHRGPDGAGLWRATDNHCALGHRRLSIIDLSHAADQPMSNQDGSVLLVFNGEIYNHAEIRTELEALGKYKWQTDHSDTEVLLHAYEEWGLECVKHFYGMFAFAIYDARNREKPVLHLVRDRIGVKPLYISRTNKGEWVFGSEIRALLVHSDISPEMDRTAFYHYLTHIVAPAPLTMFRGVFKIPAGMCVTIDHRGEAKASRYWDLKPDKNRMYRETDLSFDEACDELLSLLRKSISRRMVSDVPFGVLLSGGVDSTLNLALMSEMMDRPVTSFTIGYETHEELNEYDYARRAAERYGADHHERRISTREVLDFLPDLARYQDEPIADNVCIPLFFLSELVKKSGTTVVQVGEGADENFLGYWWCDHYREKYEKIYAPIRRNSRPDASGLIGRLYRMMGGRNDPLAGLTGEDLEIGRRAVKGEEMFWGGAVCWWGDLRTRITPDLAPYQQQKVDCPIEGLMSPSLADLDSQAVVSDLLKDLGQLAEPEILQKITHMELALRLPEHLLMRVDKMTMAHSIEARVPFLDHDIVDFASRLPLSYKLHDGMGKRILKKIAEPFADEDIIYRRKQGFGAPVDKWFEDRNFGGWCMELYEKSSIRKEGLIDDRYFREMLQSQLDGNGGGYGFHSWVVMNAIIWEDAWLN